MSNDHFGLRRTLVGVLCAVLLISVLSLFPSARAFYPASVDSNWTGAPPAIDGNITVGEWENATVIDLMRIPMNMLPADLLAMNDDSFLYLCYDVVGDITPSAMDSASFSFDTGLDGVASPGHEDQFVLSPLYSGAAHYVYDVSGNWVIEDSPFDPSLPDHTGLAGAIGFGPSPSQPSDHRIFEISIPLALLGASPGDSIGFVSASDAMPGVVDYDGFLYDTWPAFFFYMPGLVDYGVLILDTAPMVVDVEIVPSIQRSTAKPSSTAWYSMTVKNEGTGGPDTFDVNITSTWNVTLWDASGTVPLTDTDGDLVNDTGSIPSGGSVVVKASVEVPSGIGASDIASLVFTSSVDVNVAAVAELHTLIPGGWFDPPHSDYGLDTDIPPDGYFNELVVEVNLNVTEDDWYDIPAYLMDSSGTVMIDFDSFGGFLSSNTSTVTLTFSGMTIRTSGLDGPYLVQMTLHDFDMNLLDADTHTTAAYQHTEFQPPGASFSPPHSDYGLDTDMPPDGLYDYLVVEVNLNITEDDWYDVDAVLYDSSGMTLIDYAWDYDWLTVGSGTLELYFDGLAIHASGIDGPYLVSMVLFDGSWNHIGSDTHTTAMYNHTEFEEPGASFAPPHSDYGLDTDMPPDGYYNYLIVEANLNVTEEGPYEIDAVLFDSSGMVLIDFAWAADWLMPGGNITLYLNFDGDAIRQSGIDGPYTVLLDLYMSNWTLIDSDTHLTAPYNHTDFQPEPAFFDPPHSDYGLDTDMPPNGLYDYLVVEAVVNVTMAGDYYVDADLWDIFGTTLMGSVWVSTYLPVGLNAVELHFDGIPIRAYEIDGPYMVHMTLYDSSHGYLDDDIHITAPYNYTEFQTPNASFASPHSDYAIDTTVPPNGYYDYLIINASINVSTSNFYYVYINLYDQTGTLLVDWNGNFSWLDAGAVSVEVQFWGRWLYESGIDGPYLAEMYLYDDNFTFLDHDTYLTSPYLYTDFEPPAAEFTPPHYEYGLDTDVPPNGFFDDLVVLANLTVNFPGNYTLEAELMDPSPWTFLDDTIFEGYLDVGSHSIELHFDGSIIRDKSANGPYRVYLNLFNETYWFVDGDSFLTKPYSYNEFEPKAALFSPPHADYGLDTDVPPNGLYDYLVVEASVFVVEEGDFEVDALLYTWDGNWVAGVTNFTHLATGAQTVLLELDGTVIYQSGYNGSFQVELHLYDSAGRLLDMGFINNTAFYSHTDFEPPDALPPSSFTFPLTPYLRNGPSVVVSYYAADPEPSMGLDSVSLYYSHSRDNVTFGLWTLYESHAVSGNETSGDFLFGCPEGEGYYRFYTIAQDMEGNEESPPMTPDAEFQLQVPAAIVFTTVEPSIVAGTRGTFGVTVVNATGIETVLENPLDIALSMTSPSGYFLEWGGVSQITTVTIGSGESYAMFDYYDEVAGSFTLKLFSGLGQTSTSVDITPGLLDQILVSPSSATVEVTQQLQFSASGYDMFGNEVGGLTFTWATTGGIGTVTSGGQFTAGSSVSSGTVTASAGGVQGTAIVDIVAGWVHHIVIAPSSVGLIVDETQQFTATAYDAFDNPLSLSFTWSVTGSIGTVTSSGLFTAGIQTGSGSVVASADGVSGSADVTVGSGPVHVIAVTPSTLSIQCGGTQQFAAEAYDQYGNPISGLLFDWSVEGPIGTVDSSGLFTAGTSVEEGQVLASYGSAEGTAAVTLTPGPVAYVLVAPTAASVQVDESHQFTAVAYDEYDNEVEGVIFTWSATTSIGTIDQNGMFVAGQSVAVGEVSAVTEGITGYADVQILPGDAYEVIITPASTSLVVDHQQLYEAEVRDVYGNLIPDAPLVWSVVGGVATIDNGLLTAGPLAGYGSVTARSGEATADAELHVTPGPLHHVEVDPTSATVRVGDSVSFKAQGYDEHGNPIDGLSYAWEVTEGSGSLSATTGQFTILTPDKGGICNVSLTVDNLAFTVTVDAIEEAGERPAEWVTYLPLGLLVGLIVGLLIGMLLQKRLRPVKPPEEEDILEAEEEDVLEAED